MRNQKGPPTAGLLFCAHQDAEEMFVSSRELTLPTAPPATPSPMAINPDTAAAHPNTPARAPTRAPSWTPSGAPSSSTPSGAPTPTERRSPSAAPTTAPTAAPTTAAPTTTVPAPTTTMPTAMPLRVGGRWHKSNNADNQRDACAKFSEFRHRCISYGAPPRELPSIIITRTLPQMFVIPTSSAFAARSPPR